MILKRIPKLAGTLCTGLLCLAALPGASGEERQAALASGFQNPPAAAHPLTWWHWINGNVTKEGIKADMEDMKRVGIAGMQMLDVSIYLPEGPVRYGSDSWYEHIQYAIETAGHLGLEFTIMNGPGWSASGGPWVTPELSMKELVWSETPIDGGSSVTQNLEQPRTCLGFYRDVAVFAVPSDPASDGAAVLFSNMPGLDLEKLADGKPQTGLQIPGKPGKNPSITFSYPQPQERRLFRLTFANRDKRGRLTGAIEASQDGSTFEKIRDFCFDGGPELSSAIEIPFAPTRALVFRVTFNVVSQDFWPLPVAELEFSREYRTENFRSKIVDSGLRPILTATAPISADSDAIPLEKVINLTSHLGEDGTLRWEAPAGKWTVLRFGYTSTARTNHPAQPEGKGLEVDKMDASAVRAYFNTSLGRIIKTAGPHAGKAFSGVLLDSWEAGQQNWTRNFPQEFQILRGYDLMPYLPVLAGRVIGSPAQTEAVLSDFRHCVADLVDQRYFGVLREESNKHGLKFYGEAYGGACFNELQCASKVDVNMSEFWAHSTGDLTRVKFVASAVHTLGQTISAAESFTARPEEGRWRQIPADLKPVGDLAFLSGLNRAIFHTYAHQPYLDLEPGFTLGRYGTHFGRTNTWWPQAKAWIDYLSRCQFLLQSGRFVGDFLALEHDDVSELMVSNVPKLPQGYGFDLISPAQFKKVTTANHQAILPNGVPYRAVILPPVWAADLALLRQIETLVDAGVPIFGPAPSVPTGLRDVNENGAAWKAAVERLWPREGTSGQPRVRGGNEIAPWLAETGVAPDFTFTARESKANVRAIHRATPDADFYFVSNQSGAPVHVSASFRISGKQPEIWNSVTGEMAPATVFRTERSQTTVDLPLEAGGSAFVVFRSPLPPRWIASVEGPGGDGVVPTSASGERLTLASRDPVTVTFSDGKQQTIAARNLVEPLEIGPAWHVEFQPPHGKTFQRDFANLHLWRADADSAVRYFSGHAAYRTEFSLPNKPIPAALRYRIDLGKVYDLAEVKINGQSAGILWTEPFAVDVTRLLKPGRNTLEVIVTDRWVNRLIGDEQFPQDASYKTNGSIFDTGALAQFPGWWNDSAKRQSRQRSTFATWHFYEANSPLIESGLMGPVKLSTSEVVSLK